MCMTVTKRLLQTCHTLCVVKGAYVCNTEIEIALVITVQNKKTLEKQKSVIFNAYLCTYLTHNGIE